MIYKNKNDRQSVFSLCKEANDGDEIIVPEPNYVNVIVHEHDSSADLSGKKEKQIKILQ